MRGNSLEVLVRKMSKEKACRRLGDEMASFHMNGQRNGVGRLRRGRKKQTGLALTWVMKVVGTYRNTFAWAFAPFSSCLFLGQEAHPGRQRAWHGPQRPAGVCGTLQPSAEPGRVPGGIPAARKRVPEPSGDPLEMTSGKLTNPDS